MIIIKKIFIIISLFSITILCFILFGTIDLSDNHIIETNEMIIFKDNSGYLTYNINFDESNIRINDYTKLKNILDNSKINFNLPNNNILNNYNFKEATISYFLCDNNLDLNQKPIKKGLDKNLNRYNIYKIKNNYLNNIDSISIKYTNNNDNINMFYQLKNNIDDYNNYDTVENGNYKKIKFSENNNSIIGYNSIDNISFYTLDQNTKSTNIKDLKKQYYKYISLTVSAEKFTNEGLLSILNNSEI